MLEKIKFKKFHEDAKVPTKAHKTDAGYDVYCTKITKPGGDKLVYHLGFGLQLPEGYDVSIRARSSVHKYDLILANSTGTGDAGYTGEYQMVFKKTKKSGRIYNIGDKIGQLIIRKHESPVFEEVEEFEETERNEGGFGSTDGKELFESVGIPPVEAGKLASEIEKEAKKEVVQDLVDVLVKKEE